MEVATMQNINFVKFSELYNWSVQYLLDDQFSYNKDFPLVAIGKFLKRNKTNILIENDKTYKRVTIKTNKGGVFLRDVVKGDKIGTKKQFKVKSGQFIVSKIDARNGAFGVVTNEVDGAIITGNFWTFDVDYNLINPHYLSLITTTPEFIRFCEKSSTGTTNRHYLQQDLFLEVQIPLPPLNAVNAIKQGLSTAITQEKLVADYNQKIKQAKQAEKNAISKEAEIQTYLLNELGVKSTLTVSSKGLRFVKFKDIDDWSSKQTDPNNLLFSSKFVNKKIKEIAEVNPPTSFSKLDKDLEASFIPMTNISDVDGEVKLYSPGKVSLSSGYTKFQDGDLLWARITPCMQNGKSAIVQGMQNGIGYGSTEYHRIRTESKVLTKYIHLLLRNDMVLNSAKNYFTGSSGQQRVPKSFLENLSIPIPPELIMENIINTIYQKRGEIKLENKLSEELKKQAIIDFENIIFNTQAE
ncbi:restriction endonuclease subunit S [Tenacibaculum sp. XPcli2-G]|uniref:restriction endonuclease subunit S n=1 Tax=Tenacibaculum sp. XPcli2-G TaxID=2954503 RepID=UPI0020973361|nr:restriction endonuclease subunit S [Tenacibaculum sp. XPcli2-G]MCO7185048.1 restriction endonuclease subunit S [Tenacibaculum sp. XPcli2-G]